MKKLLILLTLIIIGGAGYYFAFGSAQAIEALKEQVNTQLETLHNNGFEIRDRNIEEKREHFVLHYAKPHKIAEYLRSQNIDISDEDSKSLQGLKVGVDLSYLEGAYSAISADIYPVALPHATMREVSHKAEENLKKILDDKVFLTHVDINKLFTSYKGYIKDINTTFEDAESVTLLSRGFKFDGSYSDHRLTSSSNTIGKLRVTVENGPILSVENLKGSYEHKGNSFYDFISRYHIDSIVLEDGSDESLALNTIDLNSSMESGKDLATSLFSLHVKSIHTREPREEHLFEDVSNKVTLENLSVAALEEMRKIDSNDTEGFNRAFKALLSKGITLKVDEFSAKKIKDFGSNRMIDGFLINSIVKLDKIKDFRQLEENPFLLLDMIDAKMHMEFSDAFYAQLQRRPELAIAMILFTPVSKEHKMIFDIEYRDGSLKINGKRAL